MLEPPELRVALAEHVRSVAAANSSDPANPVPGWDGRVTGS